MTSRGPAALWERSPGILSEKENSYGNFSCIDLRGGRVVRLYQGDYSQETVYDQDPCAVARRFQEAGAGFSM